MRTIINENQRGFLFKNGKFIDYLKPGKHKRFGSGFSVEIVPASGNFRVKDYAIEVFLENTDIANEVETLEVADETLALHFVNDKFKEVLPSGKYAFFKIHDKHEFRIVDTKIPEVGEDVPKYIFAYIPIRLYTKIEVADFQKARLMFDQKFMRLLEPGTYYFWNNGTRITAGIVDTRQLQMDITGQEMITLDKVALRINFVCTYKITDYVKIHTEIDDYEGQIHILLQLALREYVGKYRLDEILENKEQLSKAMLTYLKAREAEYHVTFTDAGVKDIILPGEIRSIMNTVLIAEKKALANVITRREEVASTRSLLNTAKLMDENKTLYKLKELEYIEKICDNVGNITVNGGTDLLTGLAGILNGTQKQEKQLT
ncbi:MAG: slipin family protein [Lachnospiraceae bacterium]|jgi:regulator of protease activity HflC (stomatin/prohibitin superfamily)|nr:slipin family protein [Lachnospiraceae bacterium]